MSLYLGRAEKKCMMRKYKVYDNEFINSMVREDI